MKHEIYKDSCYCVFRCENCHFYISERVLATMPNNSYIDFWFHINNQECPNDKNSADTWIKLKNKKE